VEKRNTARNGDIVIALVRGSETTVKRFREENGMAVLIPANREMEPVRVRMAEIEIQGVVVGILRKY